jgi:hypothetical protein
MHSQTDFLSEDKNASHCASHLRSGQCETICILIVPTALRDSVTQILTFATKFLRHGICRTAVPFDVGQILAIVRPSDHDSVYYAASKQEGERENRVASGISRAEAGKKGYEEDRLQFPTCVGDPSPPR